MNQTPRVLTSTPPNPGAHHFPLSLAANSLSSPSQGWPTDPHPPGPPYRGGPRSRLTDLRVWLAVRTGVSPRAVLAGIALAVAALLFLGLRLLLTQAGSAPQPVAQARSLAIAATGASTLQTPGSSPAPMLNSPTALVGAPQVRPTPTGQVIAHIIGQVRRPGLVTLNVGQRVRDAVAAAGGATPSADLAGLNLARVVTDGEQILVPKPGQTMAMDSRLDAPSTAPPGTTGALAGPVNLNTATLTDLDTLSGIGLVLAQRIVDWRSEHGGFTSVDELGEVSGIGPATLERLRPLVRV